jgi:hypothetical protein
MNSRGGCARDPQTSPGRRDTALPWGSPAHAPFQFPHRIPYSVRNCRWRSAAAPRRYRGPRRPPGRQLPVRRRSAGRPARSSPDHSPGRRVRGNSPGPPAAVPGHSTVNFDETPFQYLSAITGLLLRQHRRLRDCRNRRKPFVPRGQVAAQQRTAAADIRTVREALVVEVAYRFSRDFPAQPLVFLVGFVGDRGVVALRIRGADLRDTKMMVHVSVSLREWLPRSDACLPR